MFTDLAHSICDVQIIRINQPGCVKRKYRCKWNAGRRFRVKYCQSVYLITDEMDVMLLAKLHECFQRLWGITPAWKSVTKGRLLAFVKGFLPNGLWGLQSNKARTRVPCLSALCRAASYFSMAATESGSTPSMGT
jgi:hypothetical protein